MAELNVQDYSEKSIVVRGDTKPCKEELKQLGGKYNGNLRGGPGWIFSKRCEAGVLHFVENGTIDTKLRPNFKRQNNEYKSDQIEEYRRLVTKLVKITLDAFPGGSPMIIKQKLDKALRKRYTGYDNSELHSYIFPNENSDDNSSDSDVEPLPRLLHTKKKRSK